jgi:nucleoside-diphosphate-sugar epimerase
MDIFITGGAGFIGCNSADHFLRQGHQVTVFDNLSRVGGPANLAWLRNRHADGLRFVQGDIRDYDALATAIGGADVVLHLASQVAVTLSVQNPREDFEINALGTFNVLEAVRQHCPDAAVLYASTNKVYGGMENVRIVERATRYAYADFPQGIPESYPLDFHSPYGCCYSAGTDVLTRRGWRRFYELESEDEVLTYNRERRVAEYQKPARHFAFPYQGKMYVQRHERLETCVTPNHKMLVVPVYNGQEIGDPCLEEARLIAGRPALYLLAAELDDGRQGEQLSPAVSRQIHEVVQSLHGRENGHIPPEIKALGRDYLAKLLGCLLDDDDWQSKEMCRFTAGSKRLADDVQEIALKCGLAASLLADEAAGYQVRIAAERTARCNADGDQSAWVDYAGMVYCVEVPNATVLVRQNGHAYFSGNSKGAGDQYTIDYARIYGLNTLTFRQSCLAAAQEIVTPFGKKPIACLQPGDLVHSGRGWTRVRKVWFTGTKPVRRLQTLNGLSVTLTADHRVVRPHGLYTNREFAYGDFLAVLPEARYTPSWQEVADCPLEPEPYLAAVHTLTNDAGSLAEAEQLAGQLLPLSGDRLLAVAEIVGRLFGNGRLAVYDTVLPSETAITKLTDVETSSPGLLARGGPQPVYAVQQFGREEELQELRQRLAWLGLPAGTVRQKPWPPGRLNGDEGQSYCLEQQSQPLFTLFELLGVPVGDPVQIAFELPAWIAGGHSLVKRAFLRGFLGATLEQSGPGMSPSTSFSQVKEERHYESGRRWMEQLQTLLAEIGIETTCCEAQRTAAEAGTLVEMTVQLPGTGETMARLATIGFAFSPARSTHLNSLLRWQWTQTAPELVKEIARLYRADGELYWDSLGSVEVLPEQPVLDIEVEADDHLLLAGGIQVSNCIYGQRQFGVEDQGWVAHFVIAAVKNRPVNIYGDGKQVRDLLHVQDLIRAYEAGIARVADLKGEVFNLGGGPQNTLSIWHEFEPMLTALVGRPVAIRRGDWRPGDQRVFVAAIGKAEKMLGWRPTISPSEGIADLYRWVSTNPDLF